MNITMDTLLGIIEDEVRAVFFEKDGLDENKRKRKPNCIKGNPFHGKTGAFVSPEDDSGSWSLGKGNKSGKDCEWGQSRRPNPSRKEVYTKRPCGRKGKYRCKDGTVKEDYIMGSSGEIMAADLRHVSENDLVMEISRRIDEGNMNTDQILALCSKISQASKGDFPPRN